MTIETKAANDRDNQASGGRSGIHFSYETVNDRLHSFLARNG